MFSKHVKAAGFILLILTCAVVVMGQGFNLSNVILNGFTQRAKPTARTDSPSVLSGARMGRYGEINVIQVIPNKYPIADEGSYFVAGTTTSTSIGSSVTIDAGNSTSFSATKAFLTIKNNATAAAGTRIYIDYLKLFNWTTAPTAAASVSVGVELDNVNRAPTAGNGTLTVVNANMDDTTGSIAQVAAINANVFMTVPAAGSAARQVTQCMLRNSIPVVRDSLSCFFGTVDGAGGSVGTTAGRILDSGAPVIIGPQQFAVFHVWLPSASAPGSAEYELAWWER